MQPEAFKGDSRHLKSRIALGLLGIVLGSFWGFIWAINHLLLGGYHG